MHRIQRESSVSYPIACIITRSHSSRNQPCFHFSRVTFLAALESLCSFDRATLKWPSLLMSHGLEPIRLLSPPSSFRKQLASPVTSELICLWSMCSVQRSRPAAAHGIVNPRTFVRCAPPSQAHPFLILFCPPGYSWSVSFADSSLSPAASLLLGFFSSLPSLNVGMSSCFFHQQCSTYRYRSFSEFSSMELCTPLLTMVWITSVYSYLNLCL